MATPTATGPESYYLAHGFERDPFPLSADDILFQTPESAALVQTLRELIAGNLKTVLVSGPAGSGKSTLAEYLENHPEENWRVNLIQIENDMDRQALAWRMVQLALPEKASKPAMAIPMLHKYLELSSHAGFLPVFVLDDADRLTADTLQFVLELATLRYAESLYRFVLFAELSIIAKLADPSVQELVATGVEMQTIPPFSLQQTGDYIKLRLRAAGDGGNFSLDDKKIDAIHRIARGLPGPINTAARKAMQAALNVAPPPVTATVDEAAAASHTAADSADDSAPVETRGRMGLAAAIAGIVVVGIAGWLYLESDSPPGAETTVAIESIAEQTEAAGAVTPDTGDVIADNSSTTTEVPVVEESLPADDAASPDAKSIEQSAASEPVPETTEPTHEPVSPDITGAIIAEAAPEAVSGINLEPATEQQTTLEVEIAVSEEVAPVVAVVESPAPVAKTYTINETDIYNLGTVPALLQGMRGNSWFRQQSRSAYTLQLISASNIDNVLELVEETPQSRPELSGYVKYTPSGKPRYLMFYGLYADKDSAAAAVTTLPASLQAVNPWPRSIGNITDEIDTVTGAGRP